MEDATGDAWDLALSPEHVGMMPAVSIGGVRDEQMQNNSCHWRLFLLRISGSRMLLTVWGTSVLDGVGIGVLARY